MHTLSVAHTLVFSAHFAKSMHLHFLPNLRICTTFVHTALIVYFYASIHTSGEVENILENILSHNIYEFSLFWPITWVGGLHYSYDIAYRGSSS